MARTLTLYLDPTRVPDRAALQAAIQALRLGLKLDGNWPPAKSNAYLPCTLQGEDAGVYVNISPDAAWPDNAATSAGQPGPRSTAVALRWGGDAREHLAATIVAAALMEGFDALAVEPESGSLPGLAALKAQARELADSAF